MPFHLPRDDSVGLPLSSGLDSAVTPLCGKGKLSARSASRLSRSASRLISRGQGIIEKTPMTRNDFLTGFDGRSKLFPIALGALLLARCGGAATGTVTGKVSSNGKLLPVGRVVFQDNQGYIESATIDRDGIYRMPKVRCGEMKVTVQLPATEKVLLEEKGPAGRPEFVETPRIPAKYADPNESGLSVSVEAGEQVFNIDLIGRAPIGRR